MTKPTILQEETNEAKTSLDDFVANYNVNLPASFRQATKHNMREFQAAYPALFKDENDWSLVKHRKKVMDWLVSHGS